MAAEELQLSARWPAVEAVREWLLAARLPVAERPTLDVPPEARAMACALVEEEAAELRTAVERSDLVEIADAVADLLWVTIEAGVTFGVPVEAVFAEVHRSNLTKLDPDVPSRNDAGKIVAGPDFSPPRLAPILRAHGATAADLRVGGTATETPIADGTPPRGAGDAGPRHAQER